MKPTALDLAALRALRAAGGTIRYSDCPFSPNTGARLRKVGFMRTERLTRGPYNRITDAGRAALAAAEKAGT